MLNKTKIVIPNKYHSMIGEVSDETSSGDGYWAYLEKGFKSTGTGCHIIHEDTQKDLLNELKTIVTCDCEKCTKQEVEADMYVNESHSCDSSSGRYTPCDSGECPFGAEGGMDCRNYCGLGVDE
jgi:hypothetical protein